MFGIFKYIILFFSGLFQKPQMRKIECELKPLNTNRESKPCPHPYIHSPRANANKRDKDFEKSSSSNWSGYVTLGDNVSSVSGSWVVPTIKRSIMNTYCAIWVGIDGYNSESVEQIGTSHEWLNGKQKHYAWFEMYPQEAHEIKDFPVTIGDVISASVDYVPTESYFKLKLANNTKNVYVEIPKEKTTFKKAKRSCAEWIVEAPWMNRTLPLSNFDMIFLNNCQCTVDGSAANIVNKNNDVVAIDMVGANGKLKAETSALAGDNKNFWVKWFHE